jgi:hypothetical protein
MGFAGRAGTVPVELDRLNRRRSGKLDDDR